MPQPTRITYLLDPLCGWCYGAAATVRQLAAHGDFAVALAPTGLFSSDGARPMDEGFATYAWANDQRISRLTGQRFSEDYRRHVLGDRTRLFDSGPATVALTAVALADRSRELDALGAIQQARYVAGRDVTALPVLSEILRAVGLEAPAARLASPDAELLASTRSRVEQAQAEMQRFAVDGVPCLIVDNGRTSRLVKGSALYGRLDLLIAQSKAPCGASTTVGSQNAQPPFRLTTH